MAEQALESVLRYLLDEADEKEEQEAPGHHHHGHCHHHHYQHIKDNLEDLETSNKLRLLRQLLCVRLPTPVLPDTVLSVINQVLERERSHRLLTDLTALPQATSIETRDKDCRVGVTLWQGDITTLAGVDAITNAANSQMLGCFQPTHLCIDNVIHSWAGPGLREECYALMMQRGGELPVAEAVVTGGHALPAPSVIHVVGPQLQRGAQPTQEDRDRLAQCYTSVLDATDALPVEAGSTRKAVALCCVSAGLFAFPAQEAAETAVTAVLSWIRDRETTTITDVIFNTFTDEDTAIYQDLLVRRAGAAQVTMPPALAPPGPCEPLRLAREWLHSADAVLVTAGAGLSASDGLDYTSRALFARHFPEFRRRHGLTTLYSVFGFDRWVSEQDRWGYFFTHLGLVARWPRSAMYETLIGWLQKRAAEADVDVHVRTSNADGLFLANGWSENHFSTPQGRYSVLQCMATCRPEATEATAPFLEAAAPHLDPDTQLLKDPTKIPKCRFCGGKMGICVRGGSWFNERPFREGEARWRSFKSRVRVGKKNLVILELGVGNNTPGVLKWPDEDMVERDGGRTKLIRVNLGVDAAVPLEMEEEGLATYVDGDIKAVINGLFS